MQEFFCCSTFTTASWKFIFRNLNYFHHISITKTEQEKNSIDQHPLW